MWTPSKPLAGGLGTYNSLKDPHLNSYFRKPPIRRHLLKANIINKDNKIVEEISSTRHVQNLKRQQKRELYQLLEELVNRNQQLEQNLPTLNGGATSDSQLPVMVDREMLIKHASNVLADTNRQQQQQQQQSHEINGDRASLLHRLDRMIRTIKEHNQIQAYPEVHHRNDKWTPRYGSRLVASKSYQDIRQPPPPPPPLPPPPVAQFHEHRKQSLGKTHSSSSSSQSQLARISRPKSSYGRQRMNQRLNLSNPNLFTDDDDSGGEEELNGNSLSGFFLSKSKSSASISRERESDSDGIESLDGESLSDEGDTDAYSHKAIKALDSGGKKYYAFDKRFVKSQSSSRQRVKMTLRFNGLNNATNRGGKRNIKVFQQVSVGGNSILIFDGFVLPGGIFSFDVRPHVNNSFAINILVNGIRDLRLNTCCEHKHRRGTKLSHFTIVDVVGGRPCIACQSYDFVQTDYSGSTESRYKQDLLNQIDFDEMDHEKSDIVVKRRFSNIATDSSSYANGDFENHEDDKADDDSADKDEDNSRNTVDAKLNHDVLIETSCEAAFDAIDNSSFEPVVKTEEGHQSVDGFISEETLPKVVNLDSDSSSSLDSS